MRATDGRKYRTYATRSAKRNPSHKSSAGIAPYLSCSSSSFVLVLDPCGENRARGRRTRTSTTLRELRGDDSLHSASLGARGFACAGNGRGGLAVWALARR